MSELVDESVGLYRFYIDAGHSAEDAMDRLASVLATAVSASVLLEVLDEVIEEVGE